MRVIYKYPLMVGYNSVPLPFGAEVVHIGEQHGQLQMWVEQDPSETLVNRQFNVYGTGHYIYNVNEQHLSTVQVGDLVWHIYENIFI